MLKSIMFFLTFCLCLHTFAGVNTSQTTQVSQTIVNAVPTSAQKVEKTSFVSKIFTKVEKKVDAMRTKGGDSRLIALLLCLFLGGLGVHRFYMGDILVGIIQLLTAGGFGIWWFIDLIRIIAGGFGDKLGGWN